MHSLPSIATVGLASLCLLGCGHASGQPTDKPLSSKHPQPAQKPVVATDPTTPPPSDEPVEAPPKPNDPDGQAEPLAVHRIEAISLSVSAPSSAWKRKDAAEKPPDQVEQIGFERQPVFAADGHGVLPYCAVIVEPVEPSVTDVIQYSLSWRMRMPFKVDSVFSHEDGILQLKNAIGYWGLTEYGGEEHTLMVVHALFPGHGAVIVCDATTSVIDQVRREFEAFLKSMRTPIVQ